MIYYLVLLKQKQMDGYLILHLHPENVECLDLDHESLKEELEKKDMTLLLIFHTMKKDLKDFYGDVLA